MGEVGRRVAVAAVAVPGILTLVAVGGVPFLALVCGIVGVGVWELSGLVEVKGIRIWRPLCLICALSPVLGFYAGGEVGGMTGVAVGALLGLTGGLFWGIGGVMAGLTGMVYLGVLGGLALVLRGRPEGGWTVGFVLASVWIMDTAAYFGGRGFGRHRLWKRVSPKKTLEGAITGFLGAVGVALGAWRLGLLPWDLGDSIALGTAIGVGGQVGDLIESAMKRDVGVKDSSGLIPGHGGVLDRFDSFLFATPMVYLYLKLRSLL
ncbi:MAG TPA: phosphatidate cytidylyltransferase [Candidatus Latescibacteria bacterium]|nr:phosphatidate cytidylyltransferase [Candidatus Latescibacterota bacterium]